MFGTTLTETERETGVVRLAPVPEAPSPPPFGEQLAMFDAGIERDDHEMESTP